MLFEAMYEQQDEWLRKIGAQLKINQQIDIGQCCGLDRCGSSVDDYRECELDAKVAVIEGEYRGIVLCEKHYRKLQRDSAVVRG